ncbi:p-loop containing nucleoside triphosphate hydrolases superfamily protein [Rhynchospora pubera]|uniref:P-loop containing nucleoside triphosphate hydrolases superfamily protein n=1 Tax=Rhynchospora pubera TaxID=906938 RepID=A0AAV8HVT7_9POAL|nr:p-loop containing nucleoside triphosphate hydrolases superfamily protein [Rhynchospora pubera]
MSHDHRSTQTNISKTHTKFPTYTYKTPILATRHRENTNNYLKMPADDHKLAGLGSSIATVMFLWAIARQYFPAHVDTILTQYISRLVGLFNPYVEITFPEFSGKNGDGSGCLSRSPAYTAIQAYLSASCTDQATRLRAECEAGNTNSLNLVLDVSDEISEDFAGATFWWSSHKEATFIPLPEEQRYYRLSFHRQHHKLARVAYLRHVMDEGNRIQVSHRRPMRLYSNVSRSRYEHVAWCHMEFKHLGTFEGLAMDPVKKKEIVSDLLAFSRGKEYYTKIGRPWKRGYLLVGPHGTGKSTMVAAIANFLGYDVYDLDLSQVHDNSTLRKLLVDVTNKSILVIENIDQVRSLISNGSKVKSPKTTDVEENIVTLSSLLSFIDGLWSARGDGGHVAVFTASDVAKLDPALIRKGRMDVHVQLGFCEFEGFRVLAKNYLGLDWHPKFELVRELLQVREMTPADVADIIMFKTIEEPIDKEKVIDDCIDNLIEALSKCTFKQETAINNATENC